MIKFDLTGRMIDWESGEATDAETLELFSELVKNGMAWTLQGTYGRTAADLIKNGYLMPNGEITIKGEELAGA